MRNALEEIGMLLASGRVDLDARGSHVAQNVLFGHVVKGNRDRERAPEPVVLHRGRGTF